MSLTPPTKAPAPDPDPEDPAHDHPGPGQPPGAPDRARSDERSADEHSSDARGADGRGECGRQLSLFGVEAFDPSPADLAGLLAGPGQVVRMGGTARVTVVVDAAWRVHVLVAELARRGLTATWEATADQRHAVRTAYATTLAPLAAAWLRGAAKHPPTGFHLNGPRLRLWAAAAGSVDALGYLLRLDPADEGWWETVGGALAGIGLTGVLLDPRSGGPAYRITGRRRLARLAELVGDRPPAAPRDEWPDAAYRRTGRSVAPERGGATGDAAAGDLRDDLNQRVGAVTDDAGNGRSPE